MSGRVTWSERLDHLLFEICLPHDDIKGSTTEERKKLEWTAKCVSNSSAILIGFLPLCKKHFEPEIFASEGG